jgi:hypothetical protein
MGQTYTNLRNHVPELSRVITTRYRSYQEAQGARTRARLRQEVRRAAYARRSDGQPFTYTNRGVIRVPTGSPP